MINIGSTGARPGEYLTSTSKATQNKGSVIQIRGAVYPPYSEHVKQLEMTHYRDNLSLLPHFSKMTPDQMKEYLLSISTTKSHVQLEYIPGMEIRFIEMSGSKFTPDIVNALSDGKFRPAKEVAALFLEGKKTNMVFRGGNWMVMNTSQTEKEVKGVVAGADGSSDTVHGIVDTNECLLIEDKNLMAIAYTDVPYTRQDLMKHVKQDIYNLLKWATPSIHKSLIQKMIRTRCLRCTHEGKVYSGLDVLVTSFCMLVDHPGVFNERFQEFETGLQSATKRLAVSIAEDSTVNRRDLLGLFVSGAYAKRFKEWKPEGDMIEYWVRILKHVHDAVGIYQYNTKGSYTVPVDTDPLNLCYHFLMYAKALESDYPMVATIALNGGELNQQHTNNIHIDVPLVHCIDQHNLTHIAWHFPYKVVKGLGSYSALFGKVWDQSSSLNGRKYRTTTDPEFVEHLRVAQLEVWRLMTQHNKKERELTGETITLSYTLDDSWLSCIVGTITINLAGRNVLSMISGNEISTIMSMVKPVRGKKESDETMILSQDEKDECAIIAQQTLAVGLYLQPPPYLKHLGKLRVVLKKDDYYVNDVPWSVFKKIEIVVPVCKPLNPTRENGCAYTGVCIQADYITAIKDLYSSLSPHGTIRLTTYIESVQSKLTMHKIDRNGKGVYYEVAVEDTEVYSFLASLSIIVPAALEPVKSGFTIKNGPLMSLVVDNIRSLVPHSVSSSVWTTKDLHSDGRVLRHHQAVAIDRLCKSRDTKHIINITVGLGKTLIAVRYFLYLASKDLLPNYIVISLPSEALLGVKKQFEASGFASNVLDMCKTSKGNKTVLPGVINYIFRDHMRMGDFMEQMSKIMSETFFLLDEMHHCIADNTIRTSNAHVLAKTAARFIGMTGTLVINDKHAQLIEWLKLVIKFEVDEKNYFTALGMLVSSRIQTEVQVLREEIPIDLTREEKVDHDKSFENAVRVCYNVVTDELVDLAVEYINKQVGVFIVAKDKSKQEYIHKELKERGVTRMHVITKDNPIDYESGDPRRLQAIITTPQHSTGYTITGMHTMLTSVYFSNQATREQLDGRMNRINQKSETITIVTVHCGLLSYVLTKYDYVKSVSDAIKSFSEAVRM